MEKKTILAVALSSLVLIVFYMIQATLYPAQPVDPAASAQNQLALTTAQKAQEILAQGSSSQETALPGIASPPATEFTAQETAPPVDTAQQSAPSFREEKDAGPQVVEYVTIDTELIDVVLTNAGGNVVSWKWKDHREKNNKNAYVDLIFTGTNEAQAFSVAFGGMDAQPVTSLFYVNRVSEYIVEFYRDFSVPSTVYGMDGKFRLTKRYEFKPKEYMFELTITMDGGHSMLGFNFSGSAYTLSFGPQIGPKFEKLDHYTDYRNYITFSNGKRKTVKPNDIIDTQPKWSAISGKYFIFIAIPYIAQYNVSFSEKTEPGLIHASRFNIIRPAASSSRFTDTYRFYLGPKTQEELGVYNTGKNEFGLKDMGLIEAASSRGILSPLENLLKWLLLVFYKVIPNYGVAIILLTLLVKIVFFPLTKKGSLATLRMQSLAPKIKEIQEKYKGNQQKLNAEMGAFYKKEGYNPVSGCLPMLLQIPIFFAMYNLFNNHFDLRGAKFIPGWIPDLSVPESILNFPENFRLPLLGWTAIRLLPFIYVGSQLLYGKVTQAPGQQSNAQMKMMLYVLPIVFFFILYDVPSGLLLYWIFSNLLTLVQQIIINKYFLPKIKQEEAKPVIFTGKKKK